MDSLLHISPEFNWEVESPLNNETVYCATSIGLNSPVLFHHFLQLALRSHSRTIALTSNATYESLASTCKRNGLNVEAAIQDGSLLLIPVEAVESEYINQEDGFRSVTSVDGNPSPLPPYTPPTCPVPACSLSDAFSVCLTKLTQMQSQADSICLLVDDVLVLGESNTSILSSVRTLRHMLEDHFTYYRFVLAHPCGLDSNIPLYHALVHLSDVQMLLMPLSTGASNAVHGSLVVHRSVVNGIFRSVTLRRHVKIGDNGIRLFVPGEVSFVCLLNGSCFLTSMEFSCPTNISCHIQSQLKPCTEGRTRPQQSAHLLALPQRLSQLHVDQLLRVDLPFD